MATKRTVRVNELVKREIASLLRSDHREEAARITILEADISPDLRNGRIYYSVLGDERDTAEAAAFFGRHASRLRQKVGSAVRLKYLPFLHFELDRSIERGNAVLEKLDELDLDQS